MSDGYEREEGVGRGGGGGDSAVLVAEERGEAARLVGRHEGQVARPLPPATSRTKPCNTTISTTAFDSTLAYDITMKNVDRTLSADYYIAILISCYYSINYTLN